MKIVSVVGARPQFVKCSALSKEVRKKHREIIVHTGQHYDYEMSKVFFEELKIPEPDYHLSVGSGTHGYQTANMLQGIEKILLDEKPDLVIVYGDTNSTLAGALATVKLQIKLAHVEAGLRSFDKSMPEEVNRVLTDYCSDLLFCPTRTAVSNLKKEHNAGKIYLTGDVMVDALVDNRELIERSKILEELSLKNKQYLVATIHRQSNTDNEENLEAIVDAFLQIDEIIVFPIHPRTEKLLKKYGLYEKLANEVRVVRPLGYLEFLKVLSWAKRVLTDSGGVQKEAYLLQIPCISIRDTTEWVETVAEGWNVQVGTDTGKIAEMAKTFQPKEKHKDTFKPGACREIAEIIEALSG